MKPRFGSTLFVVTPFSMIFAAQNIVENPAKPPAPNAGRVVTVKEELRIKDTGVGFYLKSPRDIQVAPDGTIFVRDEQEQTLQFSPQGKFVKNLMKKGQGPGELSSLNKILISSEGVLLHGMPPKILAFDFQGNLLREIGLQTLGPGPRLFAANRDSYYFSRSGRPNTDRGAGWQDIPQEIFVVSAQNPEPKVLGIFPIRGFVSTSGRGYIVTAFNSLIAISFGGKFLALNETESYAIKLLDAESGEILKRFGREYRRVKRTSPVSIKSSMPMPDLPKYLNDISNLHEVDGQLWVQTSTVDAKKGILFDVFDSDGRYVDNFYLKFSDKDIAPSYAFKLFTSANGFVYFSDTTEEGLIVIKKCSLVGLK